MNEGVGSAPGLSDQRADTAGRSIFAAANIEPDEDGNLAYAPGLKGLYVGWDTKEEAIWNVTGALSCTLSAR